MNEKDKTIEAILNASRKFISDRFDKINEELDERARRIMKHKNCTIAFDFSREDHAKIYPDIPYDNPPKISENPLDYC